MPSIRSAFAQAAVLAAFCAAIGTVSAQDREPPRVTADRFGQTEVVVDDDCIVHFDTRGERVRQSNTCRDGQLRRAERADTRFREGRGGTPDGQRDEPRLSWQADGQLLVGVNRSCEVAYDAGGRRMQWSTGCNADEIALADRAAARRLGDREARITVERDGDMRVALGGDCAVMYDSAGQRRAQSGSCSRAEVARADNAIAEHVRGRDPRVTALQGGGARVALGRDCAVDYDDAGRRRSQAQGCNARELARADRSMAEYRAQRGLDRVPVVPPAAVVRRDGPGDERPGHGSGDVKMLPGGQGSVTFTNGCVVNYGVDGRRRGAVRLCNAGQLGRADELMATFRQLQQAGSGGS